MKAVIYSRVSTLKQSLERQTEDLKTYAKNNGFEVVQIFEEFASGFNDKRPKFLKLCKLTKQDVDIILIWEFSRLSRKAVWLQEIIETFTDKGINIYAFREDMNTMTEDGRLDETTKMCISFLATLAQQEAETNRERLMAARDHKIINCGQTTYSAPILGYIYDKETKAIRIDEKEANIVRMIFNMSAKGLSLNSICLTLNREGYRSKYNKIWSHDTIKHMLQNEVYTGQWNYKGHILKSPQIISRELFNTSYQKQFEKPKKKTSHGLNPLARKIICPYCGHNYTSCLDRAFHCSYNGSIEAQLFGKCHGYNINKRNLEHIIWEIVMRDYKESPIESLYNPFRHDLEIIDKEITGTKEIIISKTGNKTHFVEDLIKETADGKDFIMEQIENIDNELEELNNQIGILEMKKLSIMEKIKFIYNDDSKETNWANERALIIQNYVEMIYPYKFGYNCVLSIKMKPNKRYIVFYINTRNHVFYSVFTDKDIFFKYPYYNSETMDCTIKDFRVLSTENGLFSNEDLGEHTIEEMFQILVKRNHLKWISGHKTIYKEIKTKFV